MTVEDEVGDELAVLTQNDVGADRAVRANTAGCGDLRTGSDDGGRVDSGRRTHSADSPRLETSGGSSGGAVGFFAVRLVRAHMIVASQATLPSTVTTPRKRTAVVRQLRTVTSMR